VVDGDEDKSYMPYESYCFAGVELEIIIRSGCAGFLHPVMHGPSLPSVLKSKPATHDSKQRHIHDAMRAE
jgi:hypothetical protein